jgi:Zn-dependent peptidase ImmA (M78 family)/DNA-binding XRE family transcriptional regulator
MGKTVLNHEMVVLAREYRNLTQEQVARSVTVSQATIAKIEGGLSRDVAAHLVQRIAAALDFPVEFFYQPGERLGFGSSSYYYRRRSDITTADRRRISGVVNLLRLSLKRLLGAVELEPSRRLPFFDLEDYGSSPIHVARAVRAFWKLPEGPIKDLTMLIESAGIVVISCNFGTKAMDATSLGLADMPPMIFINRNIPNDRWRFTLAHELGHLVMHDVPREEMEDEADQFAEEFLMPEKELRAQFASFAKIRLQDLANLKPYWKVSIAALLTRAGTLDYVSVAQKKSLWAQMSKLGYRKQEPGVLPAERPENFDSLFTYYKRELGYTVDDLARTLAIFPQEFERLGVEAAAPKIRAIHAVP